MHKTKHIILTAAFIFAALATGCRESVADWEDTLPVAATEKPVPTAVYVTEETSESTTAITIVTSETTKRTAATESTPELATTLSGSGTETGSAETSETEISTVPGVPNVPISEYTSTTPLNFADASNSSSASSDSSDASAQESSFSSSLTEETGGSEQETSYTVRGEVEGRIDSSGNESAPSLSGRPYSYGSLNEKQLYIYDAIIEAAGQHRTTIDFSSAKDVTSDDYCEIYQLIYNDEYAMFYIDTKMQYAVNSSTKKLANSTVFYKYSENETKKMQEEIDAEVNRILDMITPEMTDYDKVKLFHDVLASNVVYDESGHNCRDIYGVFADKKAICGGFSKAFAYLCCKAGIEVVTVTGDADGQPHMWNKVKIDGKWYNIDVTYAVANSSAGSYVRYDYFCVPDEMLSESRYVYEQDYKYPEASSDDCSYYVKNGLVAKSWDDVRRILSEQIVECSRNKESVVQVQCGSKALFNDAVYNLFDSSRKQALDILDETLPDAFNKYDCTVVNYSQDATSLVIKLFLNYTMR